MAGLHDRPRSGRPEALTEGQQAALKGWVLRGPNPERDGVSAWRLADICDHVGKVYGVRYSEWGMSCLIERLGLTGRRLGLGTRRAAQAAFKKWAWIEARRGRPSASGPADPALVRG